MAEFKVEITETLTRSILVKANGENHAITKAKKLYDSEEVELTADNSNVEVDFSVINSKKLVKLKEVVRIKQELMTTDIEAPQVIRSPHNLSEIVQEFIGDEDREVLLLICLTTKNEVSAVHRVSMGTLNSSMVHPREIFKTAILNNSAQIAIAHNHPSINGLQPSPEDIEVTQRIKECGELLGIELVDHIIVNSGRYTSLREKGYM